MRVGIAFSSFFHSFSKHYKDIEVIKPGQESLYDLIIFSGGEDIEPRIYGQENTQSSTNPMRDAVEEFIFRNAITNTHTKFFGACRGHQFINAMLGGNMVQHIPKMHPTRHHLEAVSENAFEPDLFPNGVNSLHHQGVIEPGKGQEVLTMFGDVIESTISERFMTTQYHPEFMIGHKFFDYLTEWVKA